MENNWGVHILQAVARKKSILRFVLIPYQMDHMKTLHSKEKKIGVNHDIVKIGQKMLYFQINK